MTGKERKRRTEETIGRLKGERDVWVAIAGASLVLNLVQFLLWG